MATTKPLDPPDLYRVCEPQSLPFETTAEVEPSDAVIGQPRAMEALRFGIRIDGEGYNIYALGAAGTGKFTAVQQLIQREAPPRKSVPSDWCYVNNFEQPQRPRTLRLPAGRATGLGKDMEQLMEDLGSAIPAAFESEDYQARTEGLEAELKQRQVDAVNELREQSRKQGIALIETPTGFAFAPLDAKNEVVSPEDYEKLDDAEKERIEGIVAQLHERLQRLLRQFPQWAKESREKVKALNREIAGYAVGNLIEALKGKYSDLEQVQTYLEQVQADIIEHVHAFRQLHQGPLAGAEAAARTAYLRRYSVNVLVSHTPDGAAPVVYEDTPTHGNLQGRAEYQAQMGTLVTDFTLLKAGALHRANGGYLLLDTRKVLTQPFAWESLKRSLKAKELRIESIERALGLVSTVSLEPEPIRLDVKVILLGESELYYLLHAHDPEFRELFKVQADFEDRMPRDAQTGADYACLIASLCMRERLKPMQRDAVARVIEYSARLEGDSERLSAHLRSIVDLLHESNYWAEQGQRKTVTRADVDQAIDARVYRADRLRTRIYEEIRRGTLLIDTEGEAVGQINGLAVMELSGFAFGRPSRITATARLGEGEFVDIERETELGGAIHSKGVLILSNFFASRFSWGQPLSLSASLVFEQSYGYVEGDSASLAELCALMSTLAGVPIRQSFAVTGSVNQHGHVQAIGGVNEKLEGFYDVCTACGSQSEHSVLIPASNVKHLMLRRDVVEAAAAGHFHVYAVSTVDEAIELLTGMPAGTPDAAGNFPEDSVNGRVARQLQAFSAVRQSFLREAHQDAEEPGESAGDD